MERLKTAAILALLAMLAGSVVWAATGGEAEVRITARQLEDGRVEFALQQRVDGEWGERQLPSSRFFPADAQIGRWLSSSSITVESTSTPATSTSGQGAGIARISVAARSVCTVEVSNNVAGASGSAHFFGVQVWMERQYADDGWYPWIVERVKAGSWTTWRNAGPHSFEITASASARWTIRCS